MTTVYDPIQIGKMWVKNRLVLASTGKNIATEDGRVNQRLLDSSELEADGLGLYVVGMAFTQKNGQVFTRQLGAQDAKAVNGLAELANVIKKQGCKAILQISHGGSLCTEGVIGETPVSASSLPLWGDWHKVRALSTEETEQIIQNFGAAAALTKQAGFDGIELHACHGSLALQFMSPMSNVGRTDKYADRSRFLFEHIEAVQKAVGKDFPLGVRFTCDEYLEEDLGMTGLKFDEVKKWAVECEKMGVHFISASAGRLGRTGDRIFPTLYAPRGVNVHLATDLKKILNIPVICVGRLQDAKLIEKIVEEEKADMVAMCRPIIADPEFSKKMLEGRSDEIRQCMGCNWCAHMLFLQRSVSCPMNPAYSFEKDYALTPAAESKKVMIIGGGIGGLEAAYAAAKRGHAVTLYDKSDKLGGQAKLSSAFPRLYTRELWNLAKWLIAEIEKLNVKVVLNTEVTPELIEKENPNAVVVATGAKEMKLQAQAADGANVVYLWDYLAKKAQIGQKVVIAAGKEGIEAAISLAREGKDVVLLQEGADFDWPEYIYEGGSRRGPLMKFLKDEPKAQVKYNSQVTSIQKDGVKVKGPNGEEFIAADTVLVALGRDSENSLYLKLNLHELNKKGTAVYLVGDANAVNSMVNASHEGYWAGRHI